MNRREGFQECASALSRKLGRCGLLRRVLPKKQDLSRPLTQSLLVTICESCICGSIACSVCRERAFLRECGFRAHTSPPGVAKRQAQRSRAMRPRWLAWAAFIFGLLWPRIFQGSSRINDQRGSGRNRSQDVEATALVFAGSNFLIIRFPFAILEQHLFSGIEDCDVVFAHEQVCDHKKTFPSSFSEGAARRPQAIRG